MVDVAEERKQPTLDDESDQTLHVDLDGWPAQPSLCGPCVQIYVKGLDGVTLTVDVDDSSTVRSVKEKVFQQQRNRAHKVVALEPDQQQLIYMAKELKDEMLVSDCRVQKEATITLMKKGRVSQPKATEAEYMGGGVSTSSTAVNLSAAVRIRKDGTQEFDGSDGWAVVEGLCVSESQVWFRDVLQHQTLGWNEWSDSGTYLVRNARPNPQTSHAHCDEVCALCCSSLARPTS
jgi:hypothetical protein